LNEAGTGGIYLSNDNGANWTNFSDGLYNTNVSSIAKMGGDLYVGTYWGGVWKRAVTTVTAVPSVKLVYDKLNIYPNPANEHITVTTSTGGKLTIRNITGQLVYSETLITGTVQINTTGFPNGVYSVQLIEGNKVRTEKLIINN